MVKGENIEIESLSAEKDDSKSNEWSGLELDTTDDQKNTYYEVNNDNDSSGEELTHDLTNDIEINQMLADQGVTYNPDAEVFDINQFEVSKISSHEDKKHIYIEIDWFISHRNSWNTLYTYRIWIYLFNFTTTHIFYDTFNKNYSLDCSLSTFAFSAV